MAPEIQAVVLATQAWLQSTWHVQVPFAWLEACVVWLQEEAGGAGHLSQQQINQQENRRMKEPLGLTNPDMSDRVSHFLSKQHDSILSAIPAGGSVMSGALDQWLLTDLRDLDHPVLPEGLARAQKTELSGTFCIQVDSVLDISQPAYGQLQRLRGTDCANDEVSAVTQATQRPWEARPTRVLLMQVTDGVQSLEAMEYQSIPALSTALRPGVKLQLRGQMVCRLGVLLLGPSNITVLGGEVEDLVDRNNQGRVLCRTLGCPEEVQQQEEGLPALQQGNQEVQDLEFDDAELLASLEAQEEVERGPIRPGQDSGYGTHGETSVQSSGSSSVRHLVSTASFRSEPEDSHPSPSDHLIQREISYHNMTDEDFEALPVDELDAVIFQDRNFTDCNLTGMQQNNNAMTGNLNRVTKTQTAHFEQHASDRSGSRLGSSISRSTMQKKDCGGCTRGVTRQKAAATSSPFLPPATIEPSHELEFVPNDESHFMDEDMDYFDAEEQSGWPNQIPALSRPSTDRESLTMKAETSGTSRRLTSDPSRCETPQRQSHTANTAEFDRLSVGEHRQSRDITPALTLTSPPFTYLCLLGEMRSKSDFHPTEIRVKAFIVTLLGKLSSINGLWCICATISDGTGYLDVELSNEVLTGLLGFSVAEKGAMKRDPARRDEFNTGMRRCQEELVDMCCVMTLTIEAEGRKAVVTKAEPVSETVLQALEKRVKDWRN